MRRPTPAQLITLALTLVATAALSAGCGEKSEPDPASVPAAPAQKPGINFSRTGGLAGISERLQVTSSDQVSASYDAGQPLHPIQFQAQKLAVARATLQQLDLSELQLGPAAPSSDQFALSLTYGSERLTGTAAQLSAVKQLQPALSALSSILVEGRPSGKDSKRSAGSKAG